MKYINNKLLIIGIIGLVLINVTGVKNKSFKVSEKVINLTNETDKLISKTDDNINTEHNNSISNSDNNINNITPNNSNIINDIGNVNNNPTIITENNNNELSNDDKIINYFIEIKTDIAKYVNEENLTKVKDKINNGFSTVVDFIFYDSEIKGVTFSSLSNSTKMKVLEIVNDIDAIIIKKYPNYQVTIKGKVENIKNYIGDKIDLTKDYIKIAIGEDNYILIKEKYNDTTENISEVTDKTLAKIKEWYENKKNSN